MEGLSCSGRTSGWRARTRAARRLETHPALAKRGEMA